MQSLIPLDSAEYVGAALLSTVYLLVGQMVTVSRFRKRAGVKYPNRELLLFS